MPLVPGNGAHHLPGQLRRALLPRPYPPRHGAPEQGKEAKKLHAHYVCAAFDGPTDRTQTW